MKLSTRTRYGTRALVELAMAWPHRLVSVREIAERQDISAKYLEQIMTPLRAAGLVESSRGLHGGYELARPPDKVRLIDVYRALEGPVAPVDCVDEPGSCPMEDVCPSRDTWVEMQESISEVLESTTLQDLAEKTERRIKAASRMYHI